MSTDGELFDALELHLREGIQGELSGMLAYQNRIAANLVAILRRERDLGPRLRELDTTFAREHGLDPEAMPRSLSVALRDGKLGDSPDLRRYLRRRCLLSLAIDNPRYSGYRQTRDRWPEAHEGEQS